MGLTELNNQEQKAIRKRIMKIFDEIEVYLWLSRKKLKKDQKVVFPIGRPECIYDLLEPLNKQNKEAVLATYKITDILSIICDSASSKLSYDDLIEKIVDYEQNSERFVCVGFLSQLLPEAQLNELANLILGKIINPETFYCLILLPHVDITDNIKINNTFSLIKATRDIIDNFLTDDPVTKEEAFSLVEQKVYLLVKQEGLPEGLFKKPLALDQLESKLKVLLGLCLVQQIFEKSSDKLLYWQEKQKIEEGTEYIGIFNRLLQYEYDDDGYEIGPIEVDEDIFTHDEFAEYKSGKYKFGYLTNLRLREDYIDLTRSLIILHSVRKPAGKLGIVKRFDEKIKEIKRALDCDDEYAEAIKTASEWYFEGLCTENETFKFIQYIIAMESLLGNPKKQDRQTDRLSDRCAYLLGKNQEERKQIKKSFEKIYDVRSGIIHRRCIRLPKEKSRLLATAEELTPRVISKEIELYNKLP